jgi:tetratricopeptide (TPR) repeat protein
MSAKSRIYEIPNEEVDFYNSEKHNLPCWECLVRSTCFKENKDSESDELGYTVELGNPCIEARLTMDLIDLADGLEIPIDFIDTKDTATLFDDALCNLISGAPESCAITYMPVGYAALVRIFQRDPKYVYNGYDTAYYRLGNLFVSEFKDFENAIELYTRAIDLVGDRGDAYMKRGYCWLEKNDIEKALADFRRAIAIDGVYNPPVDSEFNMAYCG